MHPVRMSLFNTPTNHPIMRLLTTALTVTLLSLLFACGDAGPSEAELAAEAEVERLETANQAIDASIEEVEVKADELIDALDSLDILFPEEG